MPSGRGTLFFGCKSPSWSYTSRNEDIFIFDSPPIQSNTADFPSKEALEPAVIVLVQEVNTLELKQQMPKKEKTVANEHPVNINSEQNDK